MAKKSKKCTRCGRVQAIANYGKSPHAKDGRAHICRTCFGVAMKRASARKKAGLPPESERGRQKAKKNGKLPHLDLCGVNVALKANTAFEASLQAAVHAVIDAVHGTEVHEVKIYPSQNSYEVVYVRTESMTIEAVTRAG